METALSSAAPLAAVLLLGTKLPAEHLLAAPSSFRYFLTLFMAFIAEADAAQRNFSALLASSGSRIARSSISASRMCASELRRPLTLSTNTADFSVLTLLLMETSTLLIRLYTLVSFLSILFLASIFILSFLACLMTQLALE